MATQKAGTVVDEGSRDAEVTADGRPLRADARRNRELLGRNGS